MIINALSASKRHYEKYVNMCKDGGNKLLIMFAGSVSVRLIAKYWPCGAIMKMPQYRWSRISIFTRR